MATADRLYVGFREDMIAEVGALDLTECGFSKKQAKYLLLPAGDAQFDTFAAENKKDLRDLIADFKDAYPGISIHYV